MKGLLVVVVGATILWLYVTIILSLYGIALWIRIIQAGAGFFVLMMWKQYFRIKSIEEK